VRDKATRNTVGFFTMFSKTCKNCGKAFEGTRHQFYCEKSCSKEANYAKFMLDPEFRIRKLTSMAKHRAKQSGVPFDIDSEYMMTLWNDNDGKCAITKIPLDLDKSDKGKVNPYAPSFDRIIPELGYVKGNVRIVCYQLNIALSEFGLAQFDELVNLYVRAR
jgi:hypothetical protein